LLLLAPLFGELVSGHMSPLEFFNPIYFLILALPYGCGALVCRELTARWRKGWPSLLLLAVAYSLYEEGVVARSFYNPDWAELEALADYDHYAGLNWTYSLNLIHFHVTISIFASILMAEILHPARRDESWLTNRQLGACLVVLGLWTPVLWALAPFTPPLVGFSLVCLAIAALIGAARVLPAKRPPLAQAGIPRPAAFGALAALNMTVIFLGTYLVPEMETRPPMPAMFAFLCVVDAVSFGLLLRWSGYGRAWDDRHRFALVVGLLAFFIVFGFLADLDEGFTGKSLTSLAAIYALWRLARRLHGRFQPPTVAQPAPLV
jgi:hypothetical protein